MQEAFEHRNHSISQQNIDFARCSTPVYNITQALWTRLYESVEKSWKVTEESEREREREKESLCVYVCLTCVAVPKA